MKTPMLLERVPYNYIPAPPLSERERLALWREKYARLEPYLLDLPNTDATAKEPANGHRDRTTTA